MPVLTGNLRGVIKTEDMHKELEATINSSMTDYQLEEYLRCPNKYYHKYILQKSTDHLNWRQLAQYAVSHAVHEYYMTPLESRSSIKVEESISRYWTNKVRRFNTNEHYHQVKQTVTDNLSIQLTIGRDSVPPLMLFENISVWMDELQLELSVIVQLAHWTNETFIIQRFVVDEDPDAMTAYVHMVNVLSYKAFNKLPERIELITLMTGEKHVYTPQMKELQSSYDFLRLTSQLFQEMTVYKKCSSAHECTACPFVSKCQSEPDKRSPNLYIN